jgi:hypothetical protein
MFLSSSCQTIRAIVYSSIAMNGDVYYVSPVDVHFTLF